VIVRGGKEMTNTVKLGRLEDGEKVVAKERGAGKDKPESNGGASQSVLGLELSRLTDDLRARFQIKDGVKSGLVITAVDPRSEAAEKRLQPGEILLEVNQEPVSDPADAAKKIKALKEAGKKTALLAISNAQGDAHFIALPVD